MPANQHTFTHTPQAGKEEEKKIMQLLHLIFSTSGQSETVLRINIREKKALPPTVPQSSRTSVDPNQTF